MSRSPMGRRLLSLALAVALNNALMLPVPGGAHGVQFAYPLLQHLASALRGTKPVVFAPTRPALAQRIAAAGPDWRFALASDLAGLPATSSTAGGTLHGQVLGGTLRLPPTLELTGDTVIIARDLVFTDAALRVASNGHKLSLYPAWSVRTDGGSEITIDVSGRDANAGTAGQAGMQGFPGDPGQAGIDGSDPLFQCDGTPGGPGGMGGNGGSGRDGSAGDRAPSGGDINLDIPDGSTDSYRLITRGGAGGGGGAGGAGGTGGYGGYGGSGGSSYFYCYAGGPSEGGAGGDGGNGGNGGNGGRGGDGGSGGNSGSIHVTYPAGYDPSWIWYDNTPGGAGAPGDAGNAGEPGFGGFGGPGGSGGSGAPDGPHGVDGHGGIRGGFGSFGNGGAPGSVGSVNLQQR